MAEIGWKAARYFPFRAAPKIERVLRDADSDDLAEQRKASRLTSAHQLATAVRAPMWSAPAILLAFGIATPYWLVAVSVSAACVAGIAALAFLGARLRDEVRLLDATIGIPVPDGLADEIVTAGKAMLALRDVHDRAWDDDALADKVMAFERELRRFDGLYIDCLHRTRKYWLRGDDELWRETAAQLPRVANGVAEILESIVKA